MDEKTAYDIPKTMTLNEMLANYVLGNFTSEDLIDIAQLSMVQGYDSKHLRILASENKNHFYPSEIHMYFDRFLSENNIVLPTPLEAAKILACYWSRCIINETISPKDGIERIFDNVLYKIPEEFVEKYDGECIGIQEMLSYFNNYDYYIPDSKGALLSTYELDQEVKKEAQKYFEQFRLKNEL